MNLHHVTYASLCAMTLFTMNGAVEQSTQTIEVVNNSNQSIHMAANCPAHLLKIDQSVPAYTRSFIISTLTKLQAPQEMLYAAILNDSAFGIRHAVLSGANVNQLIEGKSPLLLSVMLKRYNAIQCLLDLGAK